MYYNINVPNDINSVSGAISYLLSSGFSVLDAAVINVSSGNYSGGFYNISGGNLTINAANNVLIDALGFISSGSLCFTNVNFHSINISGNGLNQFIGASGSNITISGASYVALTDSVIGSGFTVTDTSKVTLSNLYLSGNNSLSFKNIVNVVIVSGSIYNYANPGYQFSFSVCSGIFIDHTMAANISGSMLYFVGCPNINLNHCTLSSNVSGYTIAKFIPSGAINCSGNINYSILVGNGGSGNGPLVFPSSQNIISNTSCIYNFIPNQIYTTVSGSYFNLDPVFVNPSGGDLRVDINSPCACTGEKLSFLDQFQNVEVSNTSPTLQSVSFTLPNSIIYAVPPSNVYMVGDSLAIYYQSDSNLDNDMDLSVNTQYVIDGSGLTYQSYTDDGASSNASDYKLIPYFDTSTGKTQYYVQPFTMFSFASIMNTNATFSNINVSGLYRYQGFTRDRFQTTDGTGLYWVGEYYNNYLIGFSSIGNVKKATYPLFLNNTPLSVQLQDLNTLGQNTTQSMVLSNKVWIDDHYVTQSIALPQATNLFQFQSFTNDQYMTISALATLADNIVVLGKQENVSNTFQHNLYFFNKYDTNLFKLPATIFSGVPDLDNLDVGDITFSDMGELLVSVSGYVNFYHLFYDYALANRDTTGSSIKTTVLFRESYNGVSL